MVSIFIGPLFSLLLNCVYMCYFPHERAGNPCTPLALNIHEIRKAVVIVQRYIQQSAYP